MARTPIRAAQQKFIDRLREHFVRVDPDRHAELLSRPGAAQAEMGAGRDMGPGWITVAADAIADDEALSTWLTAALRYNRAVTGGGDG